MLELKNVTKIYKTKSGEVKALDDVSITFPSTGLVFISGKSGCGKTTLLNVIGGLDGIDDGEILLFGKSFSEFSSSDYNNYRNTFIGFVFQEYNLLSEFTVEKNIELTMELQGKKSNEEELSTLLRDVDISDLKKRKPSELSGGQRQRVAIARALVKNPSIIIADEPTGALDSNTGIQVIETLKKLSKDKLIIIVSHDREFAEKYADRLIRLIDGKIVEDVTFSENSLDFNVFENENSLLIKEGADLNEDDKNTVAKAIKEHKKLEVIENLSYREKHDTDQNELENLAKTNKDNKNLSMQKSKMKLKSSFVLALKSLGVKPVRLIFTIFLSVLAFAVFGLFDTVANFNTADIINNLLKNSTTISLSGNYYLDYETRDVYSVKFSNDFIKSLSSKTGLKTKGVFDFSTNTNGSVGETLNVYELVNSNVAEGKHYYSNSFNGYIEYDQTEIAANGVFTSFGYKLVEGRYPTLQYYSNGTATFESLHEIAISTYLAESIVHFLGESTINDVKINNASDLLDKPITVNGNKYTIVGLIDCGAIPSKFDDLKNEISLKASMQTIASELTKIINSGAYKCIFVAKDFLKQTKLAENHSTVYFSGASTWTVKTDNTNFTRSANRYAYAFDDYSNADYIFFDNEKTELKDHEVLISPYNLTTLFSQEYGALSNEDKNRVDVAIQRLASLQHLSFDDKKIALEQALNILSPMPASSSINVSKTSTKTKEKISENLKVVGVHIGADLRSTTSASTYRFMMNDNLLNKFNFCTDQGDYTRILLSPNSNLFGSKVIANYILAQDGLSFSWFGNYALSTIQQNEEIVRQGADLFLYIALVLAAFSIFMLFNYITTSIVNKRQSIGVLRCLGANGKDVFLMFLIESLIISIINGILAVGLGALGCIFVNMYIINVMNITIPFALFGFRQAIIIIVMSVVTAIVSSAMPIIKIAKEKPVDLIRRP